MRQLTIRFFERPFQMRGPAVISAWRCFNALFLNKSETNSDGRLASDNERDNNCSFVNPLGFYNKCGVGAQSISGRTIYKYVCYYLYFIHIVGGQDVARLQFAPENLIGINISHDVIPSLD